MPRHPAQDQLPQAGVRIGPHRQQIGAEIARRLQHSSPNVAIDAAECLDIGGDAVQLQIGQQIGRLRPAPVIFVRCQDAHRFGTLHPGQGGEHG